MEKTDITEVSTITKADSLILRDLHYKWNHWVKIVKANWLKIGVISCLGGLLGYGYAYLQPLNYQAKMVFVVEDARNNTGNLGNISSLAGQFGVDLGANNNNNILSGDNILYYFRSASLAKEVLLSPSLAGANLSVMDDYVKIYGLKESWSSKIEHIDQLHFSPMTAKQNYSVQQDSLIQIVVEKILAGQFSVERIDKKASFIEVSTNMLDPNLSKIYCERIVGAAVNRYIQFKTQRQKSTVDKLQKRLDSIAGLLSQKTIYSANLQTSAATMDINAIYKTNSAVATETSSREKTLLSGIFASVTQNLEMAKFNLSQETPVIQVIDSPVLPLKEVKTSKLKMLLVFGMLFCMGALFYSIIAHELKFLPK